MSIEQQLESFEQTLNALSKDIVEIKITCAETSKDVKTINTRGCQKGEEHEKMLLINLEKCYEQINRNAENVTRRIDRFRFAGVAVALVAAIGGWFASFGGK